MPIPRSTSGIRSSEEMKALPISPVGPVTATVSMRRFWRNAGAGGGKRWPLQSGARVDDLDQLLETVEILGVAGVQAEVVSQGRCRDHQVDCPTPTRLPTLLIDCRVDNPVCAGARRLKWQSFEVRLDELKVALASRSG